MFKYLLSLLLTIPALCFPEEPCPAEIMTRKNNALAFSISSKLDLEGNLVFSPYSIFSALCMTLEGARGKTAAEMSQILGLKNPAALATLTPLLQEKNMLIANGLWVAQDTFLLSNFRHRLENVYQARLQLTDFKHTDEARSTINEWTSSKTDGHITELLHEGDIDGSTRMLLTNAIYFKAEFISPFPTKNTQVTSFYPAPEKTLSVYMMEQTGFFPYGENDEVQWISIPFKESQKTLVIFLAKDKERLPVLSASSLEECLDALKQTNVLLKLPQFALREHVNLRATLESMGMVLPFSKEADFSGIDGMRDLFLSRVIHETFFCLDEQGVTAAGASAASINMKTSKETTPPTLFYADHPFLFFVVDAPTKTILFSGTLREPCLSSP